MAQQSVETTETLGRHKPVLSKQKSCMAVCLAMGLLGVACLCLLLSLTFFWRKNNTILIRYTAELAQVQQQLAQTHTQYQALEQHVDQIQHVVEQTISANDTVVKISSANQLVQLARYNLIYLHDQHSALSALQAAEEQVAALSNPPIAVKILRDLLVDNIAHLKALPDVDLRGTLAKLNNLQIQTAHLPLRGTLPTLHTGVTNAAPLATPREQWLAALQSSFSRFFQQVLVVRHLDRPVEPLLPAVEQRYLQQNLKLLFQQAQWALLHRQQGVYQMSLQQVKTALLKYFVEHAPVTQTALQELDALQGITLEPTLPDLNSTLAAMAAINNTMANVASQSVEPKDLTA